jgi:hypothetical protein
MQLLLATLNRCFFEVGLASFKLMQEECFGEFLILTKKPIWTTSLLFVAGIFSAE